MPKPIQQILGVYQVCCFTRNIYIYIRVFIMFLMMFFFVFFFWKQQFGLHGTFIRTKETPKKVIIIKYMYIDICRFYQYLHVVVCMYALNNPNQQHKRVCLFFCFFFGTVILFSALEKVRIRSPVSRILRRLLLLLLKFIFKQSRQQRCARAQC